jgi:AcrR family transcriptional regulator
MARPRKVSDEDVLAAAVRVMERVGPAQLRLGEIAKEAGVTAGALVQRFGSKRGLLLVLWEQLVSETDAMLGALRAAQRSPLAAVRAYGAGMARMGDGPGGIAHHLSYLQMDLSDPDFRRHLMAMAASRRMALHRWLDEAVAAGELEASTDTAELARAVEVTINGSLLSSAVHGDGTAAEAMARDLEVLLRRYQREPTVRGAGPAGGSAGGTAARSASRARARRAR